MSKSFGILLIALGITFYLVNSDWAQRETLRYFGSDGQRISILLEDQIQKELQSNSKNKQWSQVKRVIVEYSGQRAKKVIGPHFDPFIYEATGDKKVEVVVLDLIDEKAPGIILQISLFDEKSGNKIAEHGITYYYELSQN